ncbi:hypothetical protein [Lentzea nigeriaca]|nr:hypothetical protein [Lentzea nigeriaca]MBM7863442.1 hypothetical protein [Lentzea nigeriaca]
MQKQPYHRWRVAAFTLTVSIGSVIVLAFLAVVLLTLVGLVSAPFA